MRVTFLAGLLAFFAACGNSNSVSVQVTETPTATAPVVVQTPPPPTPAPNMEIAAIPELEQALKPLVEFKRRFGEPPQVSGRIRIPRIAVDAGVAERRAPANLDLGNLNPYGPTDVIFYDTSASPGYGGEPGTGNTLLSGHVDYNYPVRWAGNAVYNGPGVFAGVSKLVPEDIVEVTLRDKTAYYRVVWVREVPERGDWGAIYAARTPEGSDVLTLITCSGVFNPATQEYSARIVVRAKRY